jgi:hypothetical protein
LVAAGSGGVRQRRRRGAAAAAVAAAAAADVVHRVQAVAGGDGAETLLSSSVPLMDKCHRNIINSDEKAQIYIL